MNSPKIPVKSVHPAGGQSRPPLRDTRRCSLAVGADDSVGPMRSYGFAEDFSKTGASCRADVYRKRQTHIRSAPSSRTAVTGSDPYKAFSRNVRNFGLLQSSRERSRKTEAVFLVALRRPGGKSKSPGLVFFLYRSR